MISILMIFNFNYSETTSKITNLLADAKYVENALPVCQVVANVKSDIWKLVSIYNKKTKI